MSTNSISINVKASNDRKYVISVNSSETTVLELKQRLFSENENCDTPAERMRLIYSGRVLKDLDTLDTYKVSEGHTIHMVRNLSPSQPTTTTTSPTVTTAAATVTAADTTATTTTANPIGTTIPTPLSTASQATHSQESSTTTAASGPLPNPWANLMAGGMAGAASGAGINGMEANAMSQMMQDPTFAQYMSSMLQSPQVLESMISMNPALGPIREEARQMIRSPMFLQMISNPDTLRQIAQSRPGTLGGFGGLSSGGMNPWNNLSSIPTATPTPSPLGTGNRTNPMGSFWAQQIAAMGRGSAPANANATATAGSNQGVSPSPEERFQVQLKQMNEMGFWDPSKNIRALLAAGGNVNSAIELLFSGSI